MRVRRVTYGLALAVLAAGGCASGGRHGGTTVLVRVENDAAPAGPVTVWLAPTSGDRRSLGVVPPATTRLLRVGDLDGTTEYRLTAERQSGASSSSQPFRPGGTDVVDWRLSTNVLLLLQAGAP